MLSSCWSGAQETGIPAPKRHYIHFGYAAQQRNLDGGTTLKSDYGAAAEFGSTFFFNNRRPTAGMIRFGLDFSYLDLQYASFAVEDFDENDDALFANLGMQIGPSITVTPIRHLHAKAYAHYAPSVAVYAPYGDFDDLLGGYAGYITGGVQLSYRFLTLGVELRSGQVDASWLFGGDEDLLDDSTRVKLPGTRVIFGFRF